MPTRTQVLQVLESTAVGRDYEPGGVVKAAAAGAAQLDRARDKMGDRPAKRRGRAEQEAEPSTKETP